MRLIALTAIALVAWCGASAAQTNEAQAFATFRQLQPQCALPAVPADHELILVGAAEPQTVTNLIFEGGRNEAGLIALDVERTAKPVTLAIAAQLDVIWEFKGAVAAIERVLVLANEQNQSVGIVGIPPERIVFGDVTACHSVSWHGPINEQSQNPKGWGMFGIFFGRRPDKVIAVNNAMTLGIPSGKADTPQYYTHGGTTFEERGPLVTQKWRLNFGPDGRPRIMRGVSGPAMTAEEEAIQDFVEANPGGLVKIEPKRVVSRVPVTTSTRLDRFAR